ncbi:MAG TPA: SPOCS domain-containing protein [Symbiobacteriaceae bacterium]|nr:SPOCS domain-containing protein [Symbiobacteriaceae bacterium]
MPDAVLPLLVGEDSSQTLEDVEVEFPAPAVEIDEPTKRVEITRCEAIPGKVIVVGRVIKNIPFKTGTSTSYLRGGEGRRRVRVVCGDLRHCTLFIPFRLFVEIPGTQEGDTCDVIEACVLGEVDTLIDDNDDGLFERLQETIDIHVRVRVTRDTVVNVSGARRMLTTNLVKFSR